MRSKRSKIFPASIKQNTFTAITSKKLKELSLDGQNWTLFLGPSHSRDQKNALAISKSIIQSRELNPPTEGTKQRRVITRALKPMALLVLLRAIGISLPTTASSKDATISFTPNNPRTDSFWKICLKVFDIPCCLPHQNSEFSKKQRDTNFKKHHGQFVSLTPPQLRTNLQQTKAKPVDQF